MSHASDLMKFNARGYNMATLEEKPGGSSTASAGKGSRSGEISSVTVGIPKAVFVDDVEKFMKEPENTSAEVVLRRFDEMYRKYKFMDANLVVKRTRLLMQIPDVKQSLEMVEYLLSNKGSTDPVTSHFVLSDGVYAAATIPPTGTVMLWLGANVMLEYPIEEAVALLRSNLTAAESSLKTVNSDLDVIKDQITTLEVAMARIYNWDVQDRRRNAQQVS